MAAGISFLIATKLNGQKSLVLAADQLLTDFNPKLYFDHLFRFRNEDPDMFPLFQTNLSPCCIAKDGTQKIIHFPVRPLHQYEMFVSIIGGKQLFFDVNREMSNSQDWGDSYQNFEMRLCSIASVVRRHNNYALDDRLNDRAKEEYLSINPIARVIMIYRRVDEPVINLFCFGIQEKIETYHLGEVPWPVRWFSPPKNLSTRKVNVGEFFLAWGVDPKTEGNANGRVKAKLESREDMTAELIVTELESALAEVSQSKFGCLVGSRIFCYVIPVDLKISAWTLHGSPISPEYPKSDESFPIVLSENNDDDAARDYYELCLQQQLDELGFTGDTCEVKTVDEELSITSHPLCEYEAQQETQPGTSKSREKKVQPEAQHSQRSAMRFLSTAAGRVVDRFRKRSKTRSRSPLSPRKSEHGQGGGKEQQ